MSSIAPPFSRNCHKQNLHFVLVLVLVSHDNDIALALLRYPAGLRGRLGVDGLSGGEGHDCHAGHQDAQIESLARDVLFVKDEDA